MLSRLKNIFRMPEIVEPEKARSARIGHRVLVVTLGLTIASAIIAYLADLPINPVTFLIFLAIEFLALGLVYQGYIQSAILLFATLSWVGVTYLAFHDGGLSSPYLIYTLLTVVVPAIVLDPVYGLIFFLINVVSSLGLFYAGAHGLLPQQTHATGLVEVLVANLSVIGLVVYIAQLVIGELHAAHSCAMLNDMALKDSAWELEKIRGNLEQRVGQRTEILEKRMRKLVAAAEISQTAAARHDLVELLDTTAGLIHQRFGFYHVGIFLLDEKGEYAVLRAANSDGGKQMLAAGHRLRRGNQGIVGFVIARRRARISQNVGKDAFHYENRFLPETRSEMALPMILADKLIGILDIQSRQENAFQDGDEAALQVLANMLAVTIENARQFNKTAQALQYAQHAAQEMRSKAWHEQFGGKALGYEKQAGSPPRPLRPANQPTKEPRSSTGDNGTVQLPLTIRGTKIGSIVARKPRDAGGWTNEEINLLETLVEQVSAALDSAHLYEQTRKRATREAMVGQITAKMRASNDPDTIIKTAIAELRTALGARQAKITLRPLPAQSRPNQATARKEESE